MLVILLAACQSRGKKDYSIDERYTLNPALKTPFGGYMAKALAEKIYVNSVLLPNKKNFKSWFDETHGDTEYMQNDQVYVIMTPELRAYAREAGAMSAYVRSGNTLIVLTDAISEEITEIFNFRIVESRPATATLQQLFGLGDVSVSFQDSAVPQRGKYGYYYLPFRKEISASKQIDSIQYLGLNDFGQPDLVRMAYGKGQVIMATNARAFSNYFLLNRENYKYWLAILSYTPRAPNLMYWDDFYHRNVNRQPENYSLLGALLSVPPLRWSFWILLALGAVWVLSNLRRRQKLIPVLTPNVNSSVSFVETIAQLYFNKQDHSNLARKITTHFTDHLRNSYYLPPITQSDQWTTILHQKAGMPLDHARETSYLMEKAMAYETLSSEELLKLHHYVHAVIHQKSRV
jgi:hypothetical protein